MKSTGIVRPVDQLGRVVLPIELRRTLNIQEGDSLEIFVEGNQIILQKYERGCIFCGEITENEYLGKCVCKSCMPVLKEDK